MKQLTTSGVLFGLFFVVQATFGYANPQCWSAETFWPVQSCKKIADPSCEKVGTWNAPWGIFETEQSCCEMSFADGCTAAEKTYTCFYVASWWPVSETYIYI